MFHQNLVCLRITNLKYKDHTSFYLLLGDVSLNPGPVQISQAVNTNILETLNKKGLYFFISVQTVYFPKSMNRNPLPIRLRLLLLG